MYKRYKVILLEPNGSTYKAMNAPFISPTLFSFFFLHKNKIRKNIYLFMAMYIKSEIV